MIIILIYVFFILTIIIEFEQISFADSNQIENKSTNINIEKTKSYNISKIYKFNKDYYTNEDLDLLSRLIYAEAGSIWISDYQQLAVGTVVMNRVKSNKFPNSIQEVIYEKGQYACVSNGKINNIPDERTVNNAKRILEGLRVFPEYVIFQSETVQGNLYISIYDEKLHTTTYFCY